MKIRNFGKDTSIGECLANVRKATGLNSADFAQKLKDAGLSAAKADKVVEYEAGSTKPSLDTFHSVLTAAGFRLQVVQNG